MKKQEIYRVSFGDTTEVYTEQGLQDFVKTAVINNKDISRFSVERVNAPESSESVHKKVEDLLNDSGARAIRIAALTNELGPTVDAMCIANNLKEIINILGYGENSKN